MADPRYTTSTLGQYIPNFPKAIEFLRDIEAGSKYSIVVVVDAASTHAGTWQLEPDEKTIAIVLNTQRFSGELQQPTTEENIATVICHEAIHIRMGLEGFPLTHRRKDVSPIWGSLGSLIQNTLAHSEVNRRQLSSGLPYGFESAWDSAYFMTSLAFLTLDSPELLKHFEIQSAADNHDFYINVFQTKSSASPSAHRQALEDLLARLDLSGFLVVQEANIYS